MNSARSFNYKSKFSEYCCLEIELETECVVKMDGNCTMLLAPNVNNRDKNDR